MQDMVVIPKEKAVFWMDERGRWCNRHGKFERKKAIDYFNAAIDKDDGGFFVCHEKEGRLEKVYFQYEDTALFVMKLEMGSPVTLVLNNGSRVPLLYDDLFIQNDSLFMSFAEGCIKFTERCLLKISSMMEYEGEDCFISDGKRRFYIPDRSNSVR